jgi:hypothetical protein
MEKIEYPSAAKLQKKAIARIFEILRTPRKLGINQQRCGY